MRKRTRNAKLDLLATVEGHYASEIIFGLIKCGILEHLINPCSVTTLARAIGFNRQSLEQTLDFLARTTQIIERDSTNRYHLGNVPFAEIVFQFQKFIGAYSTSVRGLPSVLLGRPGKSTVDETAL